MEVTFKLKELMDINGSLGKLLDAQLSVRASYRLTKFSKIARENTERKNRESKEAKP